MVDVRLGELGADEFEKDNRPYCKKCGGARYFEQDKFLVRALCGCQAKANAEAEAEARRLENLRRFKENQKLSMLGERYLEARFDKAVRTANNKEIYAKSINYVKNADKVLRNNLGLYIYGDNSSGKTYLTACMCNALIESGYSVIYTSLPVILAEIQGSYNASGLGQSEIIKRLQVAQFVFIDDLGKEFLGREYNNTASKFAEKVLLEVINARYNNGKPTIFSSNYSLKALADLFNLDKAILERINEMSARVWHLTGDNFRNSQLKDKSKTAELLGF